MKTINTAATTAAAKKLAKAMKLLAEVRDSFTSEFPRISGSPIIYALLQTTIVHVADVKDRLDDASR